MSESPFQFDREIHFDPSADFEAVLKQAPGKWVLYLMSDADDRPVQLLCVKNLRYSLQRRLGGDVDPLAPLSKRVDYREIVRKISWRRVDSAFEADAMYLEAARACFPQTYRGMVGMRSAWFVHVNPEARFPRYTKTTDLGIQTGMLFGPIEDRNSAAQFVEDITDWFDLCRYYHILTEAPHGLACAYKEMGKCPAPCDGSISMEHYRRMIEWSAQSVVNPAELIRQQTARMQAAAKELRFESAAAIKSHIESIRTIGTGALRHLRRMRDFNFLSIQHGPRDGCAKAFLITPGLIEEIVGIPIDPQHPADLMRLVLKRAAERTTDSVDPAGAERIGVVAHHLFQSKKVSGTFLPIDLLDEKAIAKAYRDLLKQAKAKEMEEEGVVKEIGFAPAPIDAASEKPRENSGENSGKNSDEKL